MVKLFWKEVLGLLCSVHQALAAVDELMQKELLEEAKLVTGGTSWSTVRCVALLQTDELTTVNLGDGRAVLCEHGKVSLHTSDHIPEMTWTISG